MLAVHRILAPIDFSEHGDGAFAHAVELAETHSSQIYLLHVLEEAAFPGLVKLGEEAMYGEAVTPRDRAAAAMEELMRRERPNLEGRISIHVEEGFPGEVILEFAETRDIDMIVTSTRGLNGIERMLLGSVAQKVIKRAPCPVFVINAKGKSLLP